MHSTVVNAIEVSHLRRTFKSNIGVIKRTTKEIVAVDDVSFEIQEGELFGLLGPNGAGKTTTVKMLTTLLIPTSGAASVKGSNVVALSGCSATNSPYELMKIPSQQRRDFCSWGW